VLGSSSLALQLGVQHVMIVHWSQSFPKLFTLILRNPTRVLNESKSIHNMPLKWTGD